MWYTVYILELADGHHYTGCTSDLADRLERHQNGKEKFTRSKNPLRLVWYYSFPDKYMAFQFETYLKSGSGRAFALKRLIHQGY